jgi:TRAP-type C4-dicarboxylate transport system substrate-binding protein
MWMARLILMGLLVAWASLSSVQAASTLTLGTLVPEGTSYHKLLLEMRDKWRTAPEGGVNLRIYAGGKMGGEAKMVSQMRLGALDAGLFTAIGLAEIEPGVAGIQYLPLTYRTFAEVDFIGQKLYPMLGQRMESKGFVVLFWSDAGWVQFFTKKPVLLPDDLRQTKLFVWAGNAKVVDLWRYGKFQPVPLETTDIVPMLDTGLINAVPMPPFAALASQVYDRAPYMLELNWAPLFGALIVRKAAWEKLPAATREHLLKAAKEAGKLNKEIGRAESEKSIKVMKSKGLTVNQLSPELHREWRKVAEEFYPRIRQEIVPAEIFDEVMKLLEEHRRSNPSATP